MGAGGDTAASRAMMTGARPWAGEPAARWRRWRRAAPVAVVLGVALALRLAHWAAVRRAPFVAQLVMDSREYDRWAREIAGGDWLGHEVFFQAPLYPYLLAAVYRLFGHLLDAVYLLQIGCGVAGCYALYRAGRLTAGRRAGLAAAALAAIYGPFLFYDVQLLKESLAASVTSFLLWALAAAWNGRAAGDRGAAGMAPGMSEGDAGMVGERTAGAEAKGASVTGAAGAVGEAGKSGFWPWLLAGALLGVLALLRENALLVVPLLLPLPWCAGGGARKALSRGASIGGPEGGGARQVSDQEALAPGASVAGREGTGGAHRRAEGDGTVHSARRSWWAARLPAALRSAALVAGVALVLAPVALRNALVGGDPLPTTFQGGTNFYIGNNALADGTYRPIVPGKQVPELERREPVRLAEQRLGRPLSPAEVSRYWLGQGLAWAGAHPGDFVRLLLRKVGLFWSWYEWPDAVDYYQIRGESPVFRLPLLEFGGVTLLAALGLAWLPRRGLARRFAPPLVFAAGWMASTVVFFLFARYRLPVVPALLLLAALPVAALLPRVEPVVTAPEAATAARPRVVTLALVVAIVAALALPRLAGFAPRLDLVRFNLARLAEERGDLEEARRGYEGTLAVSPDDFLAWLDLGNLAARRRDWPEALRCYRRAAELEPASDDAQSNLGGVHLALGSPAAAAAHLARALELNPRSVQALHNSALLQLRLGNLGVARQLNERTLAVDPANAAARRLKARLAGRR